MSVSHFVMVASGNPAGERVERLENPTYSLAVKSFGGLAVESVSIPAAEPLERPAEASVHILAVKPFEGFAA